MSRRGVLQETVSLWLGAIAGVGLAGAVEGAAYLHNQVGSGGGPEAGGMVLFVPLVLALDCLAGFAIGAGLGSALGLLPAIAVAAASASAAPAVRRGVRAAWGLTVTLPLAIVLMAPERIEPLLLSAGIVSELPRRPVPPPAHVGPPHVRVARLDRVSVPWGLYGNVRLQPISDGGTHGWDLIMTIDDARRGSVRVGQTMQVLFPGLPGSEPFPITQVRAASDGGIVEALARSSEELPAQAPGADPMRGFIDMGVHLGWAEPHGANVVFAGDDDLHVLEVLPTQPAVPGRGRIRQHRFMWGELVPGGAHAIEPVGGAFPDEMIVVNADPSEFPLRDLAEGTEVIYVPSATSP